MTNKEIIEGNKLIAEFMEVDVSDYTSYEEESRKCYAENDLEYHSSWEWLMPVVEKIESITNETNHYIYNVQIEQCWCTITNVTTSTEIVYADRDTKIGAVYEAVLEFIKCYPWNNE